MHESNEGVSRLTPRQRDCLRLVYQRKTSKEIAVALSLSPGTVDTYCAEAVATLGARNRRQAAEMLAFEENTEAADTPSKSQLDPSGVQIVPPSMPTGADGISPADWRQLLPFRRTGAADNDLPLFLRYVWIPVLAALVCVGFGMLGVAIGVIADLFRGGK